MVSGGLTGFGVAQDLLHIDFSTPEEAPEEFRAQPFNAKRITTLKSGLSGAKWRRMPWWFNTKESIPAHLLEHLHYQGATSAPSRQSVLADKIKHLE